MKANSTYVISCNNLIIRIFLQGLLPIFPVINKQLGANKFQNGLMLSVLFTTMLLGTISAGKISKYHWQLKQTIILITVPLCLSLMAIGYATTYFYMLIVAVIMGFCCGMYIMCHFILLGKHSNSNSASINFSFIAFTNLLGTVIGSFVLGFCIKEMGMKSAFILFAGILFISTFSILLLPNIIFTESIAIKRFVFQRRYLWLLAASLFSIMCIHIFNFTLSLSLSEHGYPIYKIAYYTAIGTGIMCWFPLWLGKITNESSSQKSFLICVIAIFIAFGVLLFSTNPILYITAIAIMTIMTYPFFIPVMQKIFSWYEREQLPMAQSYYTSIAWLAAILGYFITGSILQVSSFYVAILSGLSLAVVSLIVIISKLR